MLHGSYGENEHQCEVARGDKVKASRKLEMKGAMDVAETLNLDDQQHDNCELRNCEARTEVRQGRRPVLVFVGPDRLTPELRWPLLAVASRSQPRTHRRHSHFALQKLSTAHFRGLIS